MARFGSSVAPVSDIARSAARSLTQTNSPASRAIGRMIGRTHTTVQRELDRNRTVRHPVGSYRVRPSASATPRGGAGEHASALGWILAACAIIGSATTIVGIMMS